ncbi:MAG: hypothetical protein RIR36_549, partial [Bacteroidota bacterium]
MFGDAPPFAVLRDIKKIGREDAKHSLGMQAFFQQLIAEGK